MSERRDVFQEELPGGRWVRVAASGDVDEDMLASIETFIRHQRKRLAVEAAQRESESAARAESEQAAKEAWRAMGWIEWPGGDCPVSPDTKVHFRTAYELAFPNDRQISEEKDGRAAGTLRWTHKEADDPLRSDNIAAYRVVPGPVAP